MDAFLKMAIGRYIWIDIPSCEIPLIGKVEAFNATHVMMSNERGLFVVNLDDIAHAHLAIQAEIVAP
jgi:hypothetical protein